MRSRVVWMAAVFGVLAAGCATPSVAQVDAFADATRQMLGNTRSALELVDRSVVDRNLYDLASAPDRAPTDASFAGVFSGNPEAEARSRVRLQLLDALTAYVESLHGLATADTRTGVDAAAKDFYGAMSSLDGTYAKLSGTAVASPQSLGAVAGSVEALGNALAEKQRAEALRSAILAADPAVQKAAGLLASELGKDAPLARLSALSLQDAVGSIRQAYNRERALPGQTFDRRLAMLREIQRVTALANGCGELFDAVSQSAAALGAAHSRLRAAVERNVFTSEQLAADVGELARRANETRAFYNSLTKPN